MVVLVGGKDLKQGHTSKDRAEQCFGRDSDSNDGVEVDSDSGR